MRRALLSVLTLTGLACAGLGDAPPETPAAPALPRGFDGTVAPAAPGLADRRCSDGRGNGWVWEPDGRFVATTPTAKFAGDWRVDGADLVWVTTGPVPPRCTEARWLSAPGVEVLLCAEGPIACAPRGTRPVELRDAGGGPDGLRRVAERLAAVEPDLIVFRGGEAPEVQGLRVVHREGGSVRRHADALAEGLGALGPVEVVEDRGASAPIVVRVGR